MLKILDLNIYNYCLFLENLQAKIFQDVSNALVHLIFWKVYSRHFKAGVLNYLALQARQL